MIECKLYFYKLLLLSKVVTIYLCQLFKRYVFWANNIILLKCAYVSVILIVTVLFYEVKIQQFKECIKI